jgi:hypothetical protein
MTALAKPVCLACGDVPTLVPTFGGSLSPKQMPKREYIPVAASIFGKIKTSDGTHPSALREVDVNIDKDVRINAGGLPSCKGGQRDIRDPGAVRRACAGAILGGGSAHVEIAFPEQPPIRVASPLTVFNGGEKDGEVTLLIHVFITVPVPAAIVTRVTIQRKGSGVHAVAEVPVIVAGSGSMLDFQFRLGRTHPYKRKRIGFLEAKCPDGNFKVSMPRIRFKNEAKVAGVAPTTTLKGGLLVPCTPKG